ncbi:gene transfer agent family protein [Roseivivax isoporae]|uniref:Gene transfer agent protein n=1 Tax=Roseivivax isoporae LMG 25204 TaxID=1449351 RepID=X7F3I6_9RHOB|nr:gene transfer agent family protein [Roseivivax isoporae]ETX26599.1 hypothetical protein RISW2_21775 [Roseivivax isoporae LMG 25204]
MAEVYADWAGRERLFRLDFGRVMEIEEACGKEAIGAIYLRLSSGKFFANEVYQIIRIALIGGGENKVEAKHLMERHFDRTTYMENAALAGDILIALMTGIEEDPTRETGEPEPIRFSEVSQICRVFHMSPEELRRLTYADFVNLVKGLNASGTRRAEPPTEAEFEEILAKYEPEALK